MDKILLEQDLTSKNTFGIRATCRFFYELNSIHLFNELMESSIYREHVKLILGGGSNVLFTKNYDGLVIKNNLKGIEILREEDENVFVKASAGENWHQFVLWCINRNLGGVENLSLIPGNVGASPMQNIGAYGVELKDVFYELEAVHLETGTPTIFKNHECEFGYRESVFKHKFKNQYLITSVTFRLDKNPRFNISYGNINQELEKMGIQELTIKAISDAVINIRSSKLPSPDQLGNAGSFFKNPEVTKDKYEELLISFPDLVAFPLSNGNMKLAAGWLIEKAGWKGYKLNDAGVHSKQALVLVNYGKATGEEIYRLSTQIVESIQDRFNVILEREVNIY